MEAADGCGGCESESVACKRFLLPPGGPGAFARLSSAEPRRGGVGGVAGRPSVGVTAVEGGGGRRSRRSRGKFKEQL